MLCPYCNEEMELGVIQNYYEISWKKKRQFLRLPHLEPDEVTLGDYSAFKGSCVDAYLCRKCEKVIIDYAESE